MNRNPQVIPSFDPPDPDSLFLASRMGLRTYGDLDTFKGFFLQFLFDFDIPPGRPVGFLADSSDELIFAIASCWELGVPFVCLNPLAATAELKNQIDSLKPGVIFTDENHRQLVPDDLQLNIRQLEVDRVLSISHESGNEANAFEPDLDPENVFGYFFTSGTSGSPKAVPLKRRQMLFSAEASARNFRPRPNHFWLLCLPLNHIGGVSIILRSVLYGSGIYRMNRFDVEMVSTFLTENTLFQAASLVPTMLKRLMEIPAFQTHKNFQAILLGGGPIDSGLLQRSVDKGIPLVSSYGMTETCAQIAANPLLKPSGLYIPIKSVGSVFAANQIEIRDNNGEPMGANNPGTIWLKGPQVFDGYHSGPNDDGVFDEEGWFNTGDFGHLNIHGQLFIESRRSDLIITGGENVSPFEVEVELEKIDPISEAAVFGLPDKEWGQKVVAVVVGKTNHKLDVKEIQNQLKARITPYKIPKQIIQAEELPKNRSGKVRREELTKLFGK